MAKARVITNLDAKAPTGTNARVIARMRLDEMYSWDAHVDNPNSLRELHNLRIAAKRLRYTFEIFAAVLPETCAAIVAELVQIQEELGALHDSDVMIELLQLCLGSQDSGTSIYAHAKTLQKQRKSSIELDPAMVADLLNPKCAPRTEQRQGLEQLLLSVQRRREEQYTAFRQHWYQLQARHFRHEMLDILDI